MKTSGKAISPRIGAMTAAGPAPRHPAERLPRQRRLGSAYKQEKHGQRRQEILDAAAAVFRAKGFHAATMQDIAGALGMKAGSLYHYLPSKDRALEAICRTTAESFNSQLGAIAAAGGPVASQVRSGILMHLDPRWRDYVGAFAFYRGALPAAVRRPLNGLARDYLSTWRSIIDAGLRAGELRAGIDSELAAAGLVAMCNGIIGWFGHKTPVEIRATGAALADTMLGGLLARAPGQETKAPRTKVTPRTAKSTRTPSTTRARKAKP